MNSLHPYAKIASFLFIIASLAALGTYSISMMADTEKVNNSEKYVVVANGRNGAAIGLGIISAALYICSCFFMYKGIEQEK